MIARDVSDMIQTIKATQFETTAVYIPTVVETETADINALEDASALLREAAKTNTKIVKPSARIRPMYAKRSSDSTPIPDTLLANAIPRTMIGWRSFVAAAV